jgi:hypothetical protein
VTLGADHGTLNGSHEMKSALISFAATALLLALHVAPSMESLRPAPSAADAAFAARHANEQTAALEAELGLEAR